MERQRSSDRRREPRFRPEIELYAVVRGDSRKLGSVIDLSMTGLAFQYIETSNGLGDHTEIDVFSVGKHFRIEKVPVTVVCDDQLALASAYCRIAMRRVGVRFQALQAKQVRAFERLIRSSVQNPDRRQTAREPKPAWGPKLYGFRSRL